MARKQRATIFGAGYVGLTTAVLFANCGVEVTLVEVNPERLKSLRAGKSFFYEAGINELLQNALKQGSLGLENEAELALKHAGVIFSCVGTPDYPDGSSNLSYVYEVADRVAAFASDDAVFVQKSTVPVGTGEKIEASFKAKSCPVSYVSNPEFLREGTAIQDSLWFDRVVVGGTNPKACQTVIELYKRIEENRDKLAKIAGIPRVDHEPGHYITTNRNSAELIKVTANAFLALKISFANSIAKLADQADADVNDVMDAVGADRRIGRAFLNAGRGYGGGCFPKDVSGLIASASDHGVDMPIMIAASDVNESMPGYIAKKVQENLKSLQGKKIAVLGLSFKSGTSDARKSPGVSLANSLDKGKADVQVYDPHANGEAKEELRNGVKICNTMSEAITKCDAVIIATDWPEFKTADIKSMASKMSGSLFVDAMNCFDKNKVKDSGLKYVGVGRT